jgi:Fe-Mn family superoxide dismutase
MENENKVTIVGFHNRKKVSSNVDETATTKTTKSASNSPEKPKEPQTYINTGKFVLPALPYSYDSLEPYIDKITMEIHHTKHHGAYVANLNTTLEKIQDAPSSIEEILMNISKYPIAVRNNGGGHYNHSLFWKVMSSKGGGHPNGKLLETINSSFGSFDNFKTKFNEAATKLFGSGWTWLVLKNGKLEIGTTPNQDNPLMDISEFKGVPILCLDIWEHAYYLKHQNKRLDYINDWWKVVNWDEVSNNFKTAK